MQNRMTAVLLAVAALSVSRTLALNCYVCNSLVDKDCASSSTPKDYLVNCTSGRAVGSDYVSHANAKICWKQSQDIDGFTIVDRTCGPAVEGNTNTCYDRVGTKKIKVRYCLCTNNECNGAVSGAAASVLPMLLAATCSSAMWLGL